MVIKEKIVCAECKKEIPIGFMAISYKNKFLDSYRCLATLGGVKLDGTSFSTVMDKAVLKTILKE